MTERPPDGDPRTSTAFRRSIAAAHQTVVVIRIGRKRRQASEFLRRWVIALLLGQCQTIMHGATMPINNMTPYQLNRGIEAARGHALMPAERGWRMRRGYM